MSNAPRSGGIGEAIGAYLGFCLGAAIGVFSFQYCANFGLLAQIASIILSVALAFVLMIGGAILGNAIRF